MPDYFPFTVSFINGALYGSPEQMHQIKADFFAPNLSAYKALFDRFGALKGELSLVDVTALIIKDLSPNLFENMDFDEEGYLLDMHVDSELALDNVVSTICPVYRNLESLERYVRRIATS